jgi:predicted nuclease of predicted toxin-antitoxin system
MTQVRFQADADLKQAIVTGVIRQQPTIDFQSANQAGLEGLQDAEVLALAAQQGRILVTHDLRTMPTEFGQFIGANTSAGVLVISQNLPVSEAIESLILVWEVSTAEEWKNKIMTLPF